MLLSKIYPLKSSQIVLLLVLFAGLTSCGTYQSVYNENEDGIYASDEPRETVIIQKKSDFDQNYFSKQLDELQELNENDTPMSKLKEKLKSIAKADA